MERIGRRGRDFERSMPPEYITALCEAYNYFFFHYDSTPLLIVNTCHVDFVNDARPSTTWPGGSSTTRGAPSTTPPSSRARHERARRRAGPPQADDRGRRPRPQGPRPPPLVCLTAYDHPTARALDGPASTSCSSAIRWGWWCSATTRRCR